VTHGLWLGRIEANREPWTGEVARDVILGPHHAQQLERFVVRAPAFAERHPSASNSASSSRLQPEHTAPSR